MDDVSDAIRTLGQKYTVTRTAATTRVDGYATPGAVSTFTTFAVEQPLSGDQMARLPEGARSRGARGLICDQALVTADPGPADVVELDGSLWEVQDSKPWRQGNFYEVVVARKP